VHIDPLAVSVSQQVKFAPSAEEKPIMTLHRMYPSELRHQLERTLPYQNGTLSTVVRVTPRDRDHRKCAVWNADHYEVQAYYTTSNSTSLDRLKEAMRELPGVYMTTQVRYVGRLRNLLTNPEWPAALGTSRRGLHDLRPQVLALVRVQPPEG
jgi:hypothetical protein